MRYSQNVAQQVYPDKYFMYVFNTTFEIKDLEIFEKMGLGRRRGSG
ncbi:hypothetical protein HMPREF1508_0115 [Shuttleworthella sp. MSX8B]|nr:hypothetical protein HMPREF1508_0115 [Shuttleworthia sp. MSX8B]